jgi:hypothetical protein
MTAALVTLGGRIRSINITMRDTIGRTIAILTHNGSLKVELATMFLNLNRHNRQKLHLSWLAKTSARLQKPKTVAFVWKNTTTTACGHQFHFGCLAQHTRLSNSCPMCRTAICPEVPKRVLKLPPRDDVLRFAVGASLHLGEALGNMMSMDQTQVEFVSEALGQIIADTNISLMRNIERRNP